MTPEPREGGSKPVDSPEQALAPADPSQPAWWVAATREASDALAESEATISLLRVLLKSAREQIDIQAATIAKLDNAGMVLANEVERLEAQIARMRTGRP